MVKPDGPLSAALRWGWVGRLSTPSQWVLFSLITPLALVIGTTVAAGVPFGPVAPSDLFMVLTLALLLPATIPISLMLGVLEAHASGDPLPKTLLTAALVAVVIVAWSFAAVTSGDRELALVGGVAAVVLSLVTGMTNRALVFPCKTSWGARIQTALGILLGGFTGIVLFLWGPQAVAGLWQADADVRLSAYAFLAAATILSFLGAAWLTNGIAFSRSLTEKFPTSPETVRARIDDFYARALIRKDERAAWRERIETTEARSKALSHAYTYHRRTNVLHHIGRAFAIVFLVMALLGWAWISTAQVQCPREFSAEECRDHKASAFEGLEMGAGWIGSTFAGMSLAFWIASKAALRVFAGMLPPSPESIRAVRDEIEKINDQLLETVHARSQGGFVPAPPR